jgi:hypothetical protein
VGCIFNSAVQVYFFYDLLFSFFLRPVIGHDALIVVDLIIVIIVKNDWRWARARQEIIQRRLFERMIHLLTS